MSRIGGVLFAVALLGAAAAPDGRPAPANAPTVTVLPSVEVAHYEVVAGDYWLRIATKLSPPGATQAQLKQFATDIVLANPPLTLASTIHPGNVLRYVVADVPVVAPPPTTTSSTTSTTLAPTTTSSTTTTTMAGPTTTVPPPGAFLPFMAAPLTVAVGPPNPTSQGEGNFRTTCGFSHLNYDDAIVSPGVPGAAHLHMYAGNTGANASSTYESLRNSGRGTCDGDTLNRSAYWAPAALDAQGRVLVPDFWAVYYKSPTEPTKTTAPPPDLKMIAGYDMAGPLNQPMSMSHITWSCDHNDGAPEGPKTPGTQNCAPTTRYPTGLIIAEIQFPPCWDGVNLDSANHRSHMAYAVNGTCPTTHPVRIPEVSYKIGWSNALQASTWKLSSDTMPGMTHANGTTLHADWIGAWDPSTMQTLVTECIVAKKDCNGGNLGNGRALKSYGFFGPTQRYGSYTGPLATVAPPRA